MGIGRIPGNCLSRIGRVRTAASRRGRTPPMSDISQVSKVDDIFTI